MDGLRPGLLLNSHGLVHLTRVRVLLVGTASLMVAVALSACGGQSSLNTSASGPSAARQSTLPVVDQPTTDNGSTAPDESPLKKVPTSPLLDRLARCLQQAGWTVTRDYSGMPGIKNYPSSQSSAVQKAMDTCYAQTGYDKAWDKSELSTAQLRDLYQQELAEHDCVLEHGMQSYHPPSLQTYIDTYGTAEQYYAMRPGMDGIGATNPAWRQCPPPTYYMKLPGM